MKMTFKSRQFATRALAAAAIAFSPFVVLAGGPNGVCGSGVSAAPVKYAGAGTIMLRYDQGILGSRTKAASDALVTTAISLWTNVPSSSVTIARSMPDLPVDVVSSNFGVYDNHFSDGINPVIYDSDGAIIDDLYGTGANNGILGFAGSAWSGCTYLEGQAVLNGKPFLTFTDSSGTPHNYVISDQTMITTIAHEIGHLIGLDHTQLNNVQGGIASSSAWPLMYPIANRTLLSLHEDDVAAVSALYPDATINTAYGQLTGNFTTGGGTPVLGANIFASGTGGNFSVVSDYLGQGTGFFRLYLPPGTYTLRAGAIDPQFTGGSGVGPYSLDWNDNSFLPPIYTTPGINPSAADPDGTDPTGAMAIVALGGATPTTITITAGCVATATFRMNGTGSVGGNCNPIPIPTVPTTVAPSGAIGTLTPTYTWNASPGATSYNLYIWAPSGQIASLPYSATAAGCAAGTGTCSVTPATTLVNGTAYNWNVSAANNTGSSLVSPYRAFNVAILPAKPVTVSPTGSIATNVPTYTWNAVADATSYELLVTTSPGGSVAYFMTYSPATAGCSAGTGTCSVTPAVPLGVVGSFNWYVSALNSLGTSGLSVTRTFTLALAGPVPVAPTQIGPTGTFTSSQNPTYSWNAVSGATSYWLRLSNNVGGVWTDRSVDAATAGCAAGTGTCSFRPGAPVPLNTSWTWVVSASNANGMSPFSAGLPITVAAAPPVLPAVPTQIGPSGTFTSSQNPTYSWNAVSGATGYWLKLTNATGGVWTDRAVTATDAGCAAGTGTCSFRPGAAVPNNTSWTWVVASTNANGQSAFSAGLPITVAVPEVPKTPAVPAVPTQIGPTGTFTSSQNPTYSWNAVSGATGYWLKLTNATGGVWTDRAVTATDAGCAAGTGTCSFRPGAAVPNNTSWTWVVASTNADGQSAFSAGLPITVAVPATPPAVPAVPTQIGPSGTFTSSQNPTYSWNAVAGATGYWLKLTNSTGGVWTDRAVTATDAGCAAGTGTCSFRPGAPVPNNTSWTWFVASTNANGQSAFSAGLPITVAAGATIPSTPTQVGPTGTLTLTFNPTYVWTASPNATSYWLRLQNSGGVWTDRSVTAAEAGCAAGTGNCSFVQGAGVPNDTSWTWVVNAANDNGASPFSAGLPIMINVPHLAPTAPTLISPVGTIGTTMPTYTWNASAGASSYTLRAQNTSGTALNVSVTAKNAACPSGTGVCTYTPTTALGNHVSWDWSVSATNPYGTSAFSAATTIAVNAP